jgi:spore coat polysaccharide biosynthesis protein SpsF (cytidylyltransferase family)/aryl-alcohol dehydrogenase-like predicted oxidoreductase
MKPTILIQCRSSSSRLPGKALLPVVGFPSVILCARRAANTGLDVKIVTSTDSSDDALCEILKAGNVPYFRGDLENVLRRFTDALDGVADDTPVVRLTADNLFVDGALIEESLVAFQEQGKGYLSLHPPALTGTPYGLSVEVFAASTLRAAHSEVLIDHDQEHVTPWIIRKYGLNGYRPKDVKPAQAHLRCTMDTWQDYQRMILVFGKVSDPITVTWQELCDHLHDIGPVQGIPQRFTSKGSIAELALGTVQLGLSYGIANLDGQPLFEEAKDLVYRAIAYGVTHLDCAAAYGEAEARLGQIVNRDYQSQVTTVTKLAPLTELPENASDQEIRTSVEASVYKSCCKLSMPVLPYLLLHRWQHKTSHEGRIWERIKQFQQEGVIRNIGASIQNPEEALQAIADPDVKFIQLPFNLLDRRFQRSGFSEEAKNREDVIIQVRSVLLQGLLVSPMEIWPEIAGISAAEIVNQLAAFTKKFKRESVADLCIGYVRSQSWVDCLVIGMEKRQQLDQNVMLFQNSLLNTNDCAEIEETFSDIPEGLLNPALWPKKNEETA